jgi:mono/diheme cytochrome c family protein
LKVAALTIEQATGVHSMKHSPSRTFLISIFFAGVALALMAAWPVALGAQGSETIRKSLRLPLDGGEIFQNYCAACHGSDGKGHGPVAEALRHAPPDLTLMSRHNKGSFPSDKVQAILAGRQQSSAAHGTREMPIWGPIFHTVERDQDFGEVRLANVTKFLESLQQK